MVHVGKEIVGMIHLIYYISYNWVYTIVRTLSRLGLLWIRFSEKEPDMRAHYHNFNGSIFLKIWYDVEPNELIICA